MSDLGPGSTFAAYRIERELGRGGMGVVLLALQPSLNRRVALKVIAPSFANDAMFRSRFEREAMHSASLDHPNVVPVYDTGEFEGQLYLAMRYVEGTDLASVLASRGRLPAPDAARIVQQLASALDAAHGRGLIHRDVKPANVLIAGQDTGGHLYLSDFGLTKEASAGSGLTQTGQWVGTINYVAPEQIEGHPVDARADVYSLGCVLYECLTGRLPYEGTDVQKMWGHVHGEPDPPSRSDPSLSPRIDEVLARALAKRPAERYPSAGDFGRAATAAAAGQAIAAPERSVARGAAAGAPATAPAATQRLPVDQPPPPPPAPYPPGPSRAPTGQLPRAGSRVLPIALALVAVAIAGAAAAAVLLSGGDGDGGTASGDVQTDTVTRTSSEDGSGSPGSSGTGDTEDSVSYSPSVAGFSYNAELPASEGWGEPVEDPTALDPGLRTTVRAEDGTFVIIDYTPSDSPSFGDGPFQSERSIPHPEFGTATEIIFSQSEQLPECNGSPCVDILVEDGAGGGWGVVGGGPDFPGARRVASQVAESVTG